MPDTTDERRIDQEIHLSGTSTDPFASAVRATRMPMLITDPRQDDNPIIFVNDAFGRLTGYGREETLGRNCRFLQGPGTNARDVTRIREAVRALKPIEIDLLNYRKDGTTFWNRLLISPVFDTDGECAYFFASQFDVTPERDRLAKLQTDRRTLEQEIERRVNDLTQSEERLRFTLKAGRLGAWTLDLADRRLVASAICKENFGRRPTDPLSYEEVEATIHPDDRATWKAAVHAALDGSGELDIEYRIVRPDGALRWIEIRGQTAFDASGAPISMAGVSLDVTDRKRTEADLRELEDRRSLAIAVGDVGIFDVDLVSQTVVWDDQIRRFYGMSDGRPIDIAAAMDAVHPDDRGLIKGVMSRVRSGEGESIDLQYRVNGIEDGVTRHIYIKGRVIMNGRRPVRIVGAARDVTDLVEADKRRQMLNGELAHRLKNTLAVVQSIATQTLRSNTDLDSARRSLSERIQALAKAQDILLTGQRDAGSIGTIIRSSVSAHDDGSRIRMSGPELFVGPKAALSLALLMHELATNASKYGSLSVPDGSVEVDWEVRRDGASNRPALELSWSELNGPPAVEPARKGFGSRLIRMGLDGAEGETEPRYTPEGFRYRLAASLTELQSDT